MRLKEAARRLKFIYHPRLNTGQEGSGLWARQVGHRQRRGGDVW